MSPSSLVTGSCYRVGLESKQVNKMNDELNLKEYIDENFNLLSTIGIFIALFTYSASISNFFAKYVLLFSVFITVILLKELPNVRAIEKRKISLRVALFYDLITCLYFLLYIYALLKIQFYFGSLIMFILLYLAIDPPRQVFRGIKLLKEKISLPKIFEIFIILVYLSVMIFSLYLVVFGKTDSYFMKMYQLYINDNK